MAKTKGEAVLSFLCGRGGFDDWWFGIDKKTQLEIADGLDDLLAESRGAQSRPDGPKRPEHQGVGCGHVPRPATCGGCALTAENVERMKREHEAALPYDLAELEKNQESQSRPAANVELPDCANATGDVTDAEIAAVEQLARDALEAVNSQGASTAPIVRWFMWKDCRGVAVFLELLKRAQSRPEPVLTLPDHSFIDASELTEPGTIVGVQGQDFDTPEQVALRVRDVLAGEIDEDPEAQSRPDSSVGSSGSQDRAAWAVAVLDAWSKRIGKSCAPCPDGDGYWFIPTLSSCFTAESPDACRIKAAEALVASDPSLNVQPEPSQDAGQGDPYAAIRADFAIAWDNTHPDSVAGQAISRIGRVITVPSDFAVPESTVPSQAAGGWIRMEDRAPELETMAWIVWSSTVQSQPWQWIASDESGPVWYFDGHEMPDGEVSHYMPVKVPPAPEKP
jgi:hypothetical protein